MMPNDQRSEANVASSPLRASGAIYSAVPTRSFLSWHSFWVASILSKFAYSDSFLGVDNDLYKSVEEFCFYSYKSGMLDPVEVELCKDRSEERVFNTLAVPKSARIICQCSLRRMLLGLRSLWTMLFERRKLRMVII